MHLHGFAIAGLVRAVLVVLVGAGLRPTVRTSGTSRVVVVEPGEPEDDDVIADEVVADETLADETSPSREDD